MLYYMKRVAIDIDEVLMPFVRPMARWKGVKMPPSILDMNMSTGTCLTLPKKNPSRWFVDFTNQMNSLKSNPSVDHSWV